MTMIKTMYNVQNEEKKIKLTQYENILDSSRKPNKNENYLIK